MAYESLSPIHQDSMLIFPRTFIFGGHDTTAAAIAWLLYEMAANPEDQAKIRQEIFTASSEGKLTTKDYDSLQLLNAAIKVGHTS